MKLIIERYELERARVVSLHIALAILICMYYRHPDATMGAVISYLLGHLTANRVGRKEITKSE